MKYHSCDDATLHGKRVMILGGPDLFRGALSEQSFLWFVAEGKVGDLKHEKDSICHHWLDDGGSYMAFLQGKEWEWLPVRVAPS